MKENIRALKAVLSAFIGVQKQQNANSDEAHLNPLRILFVGIFCVLIFVLILISIVKFIVQ